jgi:hypothetical protein
VTYSSYFFQTLANVDYSTYFDENSLLILYFGGLEWALGRSRRENTLVDNSTKAVWRHGIMLYPFNMKTKQTWVTNYRK